MSFSNRETKGRPVAIKDEGISLTTNVGSIDNVGAGVTATTIGSDVTLTIPGGSGNQVTEEIPSGSINGSNVTFTLAHTPTAGTLKLFLNGARQQSGGGDYTLSGATITFNIAPPSGSILLADYSY